MTGGSLEHQLIVFHLIAKIRGSLSFKMWYKNLFSKNVNCPPVEKRSPSAPHLPKEKWVLNAVKGVGEASLPLRAACATWAAGPRAKREGALSLPRPRQVSRKQEDVDRPGG